MVPNESYAITHARFWVFNNWPGTTNDGSVYFKNYYVTKFSSETNSNIFTTAAPTEAPETTHPITTTVEPGNPLSSITQQASLDDLLRTVHPSTCPCGQRSVVNGPRFWAQTVHLMDRFGQRTTIIILRWTSGRIFDHGPSTSWTEHGGGRRTHTQHGSSTSWTESDDGPWSFAINGQRWTVDEHGS